MHKVNIGIDCAWIGKQKKGGAAHACDDWDPDPYGRAARPAAGYVDHPPLSIWILTLSCADTLPFLRLFPALAGAFTVILAASFCQDSSGYAGPADPGRAGDSLSARLAGDLWILFDERI